MENIRLIVSDLDGTLLNSKKWISDYSVSVLKEASSRGIKICLASGRYEPMMALYTQLLGCVSYMISSNGAFVREVGTERVIHHNIMPERELSEIAEFLRKNGISFVMYSGEMAYYQDDHIHASKRMEDYERLSSSLGFSVAIARKPVDFNRLGDCTRNIIKLVVYENRKSHTDLVYAYLSGCEELYIEGMENNLMGIYNRNVSKKTALCAVMDELKIDRSQVAVFGDYENDLSMFECAQTTVAVENAVEELKSRASFITFGNDDDGVAKFIKSNLINK